MRRWRRCGDVATGLVHAHGKGVLHCDLKPANVLLDQDGKPRLADFGQSRLSTEQAPALGTMFYMAPEQADLAAAPDVRWDVYALGALLVLHVDGRPAASDGRDGRRVRADARPGRAAGPLPAVDRAVAAAGGASQRAGRGQDAGGDRRPLSGRRSEQAVRQRAGGAGRLGRSGVAAGAAADDGSGGDRAGAGVGGGGVVCLAGVQRGGAAVERGLDGAGLADATVLRPSTSPASAANELERRYRAVDQVAASRAVSQATCRNARQARTCTTVGAAERSEAQGGGVGAAAEAVPRFAGPAGAAEGV